MTLTDADIEAIARRYCEALMMREHYAASSAERAQWALEDALAALAAVKAREGNQP